jgi:hypothetical protein
MKNKKDLLEYLVVGADEKGVRNWCFVFARSKLEAVVKGNKEMKMRDISWVLSGSEIRKASIMNLNEMYTDIYG